MRSSILALILIFVMVSVGVFAVIDTSTDDSVVLADGTDDMPTRATLPRQKTEGYEPHTTWDLENSDEPQNQPFHNWTNYLEDWPQREFWLRCKNMTEDYQWLDDVNFTTNGDEIGLCKEDLNLTQTQSDPMNFSYPKIGQEWTAQYDNSMGDMGVVNFTINPVGLLPSDVWTNPNMGALKEIHVSVIVDTDGDYDWKIQDGTIEGLMRYDFNYWDTPYDPMDPAGTIDPYVTKAEEMFLTQRQEEEYMDGVGYWMDINDDGFADIPGDIDKGRIWVVMYRTDNEPSDLNNLTVDLLVYCGFNEKLSWLTIPYKHPAQLPLAETGVDMGFPKNREDSIDGRNKFDSYFEDPIFDDEHPQIKEGDLITFDGSKSYDPQDDVGLDGLGYGHPDWPGPDDGDGNFNIDDGFPEGDADFGETDTLKYKWEGQTNINGLDYRVPMASGWQNSPIFVHKFRLPSVDSTLSAEDQWLIVNVTLTVQDQDMLQDTHTIKVLVYKSQNAPTVLINVNPQTPPEYEGKETYILQNQDVEFNGWAFDPDPNSELRYVWKFQSPSGITNEIPLTPRVVQPFDEVGDWNVSLTVYDGDPLELNTMSTTKNYIVHVIDNEDPVPVIRAGHNPPLDWNLGSMDSSNGRTVYFNGSLSYDPDVFIPEGEEEGDGYYVGLPGWDEDDDLVPDYPLKYRWTWGDSTETPWSFTSEADKVWYSRGAKSEEEAFWPVKLWVWDGREQIESLPFPVYINLAPTADAGPIRPTPVEGEIEEGMVVTFDGVGSYDPNDDPNNDGKRDSRYDDRLEYVWDFGDGSPTVTERIVEHVYVTATEYVVRLTVRDGEFTATDTTEIKIVPENRPPRGDVTITADEWIDKNTYKLYTQTHMSFDALESYDPDGIFSNDDKQSTSPLDDLYGLTWDFGDGSPPESNPYVDHQYNSNGTFIVTLNMSDRKAALWEESWTIIVENRAPFAVAKIDMVKQSIKEQPIILSAEGSFDRDGEIVGYYWDYGDGTHSDENKGIDGYETGYTKAHEYEKVGTYYVKVRVKDNDGRNSDETAEIQVIIFSPDPPPSTPVGSEVIIGGLLGTVALIGVLSSSFVWLRKRD